MIYFNNGRFPADKNIDKKVAKALISGDEEKLDEEGIHFIKEESKVDRIAELEKFLLQETDFEEDAAGLEGFYGEAISELKKGNVFPVKAILGNLLEFYENTYMSANEAGKYSEEAPDDRPERIKYCARRAGHIRSFLDSL